MNIDNNHDKDGATESLPAIFTRFSHMLFGRATPLLYANSSCKSHLSNKAVHYTSPQSQNEIICMIGKMIQQKIVDNIKEMGNFALICDETMDISRLEQLSVCV